MTNTTPEASARAKKTRPKWIPPSDLAAERYLAELLVELPAGFHDRYPIEPTWDKIFELERRLLETAGHDQLLRRAWVIRNRYREVAGEPKFALYTASNPPMPKSDDAEVPPRAIEALRADLLELHREIARETIFSEALEQQRALLSARVGRMSALTLGSLVALLATPWLTDWARVLVVSLVVVVLVAWFARSGYSAWRSRSTSTFVALIFVLLTTSAIDAQSTTHKTPTPGTGRPKPATPVSKTIPFTPATTLTMAAMAGFLGGAFSVVKRIQSQIPDGDAVRNLQRLVAAESYIVLAPISGAIAALVLYAFFCGSLFDGALFPKIVCATNMKSPVPFDAFLADSGPATCADHGKVLVWCFIAGFAERFVPDAIDRLTKSSEKK